MTIYLDYAGIGRVRPAPRAAMRRAIDNVLAEGSGEHESFSAALDGGLEYPHYTRPAEYRGWNVPAVLLSGDHGEIDRWRHEQSRVRSVR